MESYRMTLSVVRHLRADDQSTARRAAEDFQGRLQTLMPDGFSLEGLEVEPLAPVEDFGVPQLRPIAEVADLAPLERVRKEIEDFNGGDVA